MSDPQSNTASSCHCVHSPQQLTGYSTSGYASPVTSVSWSTTLEMERSEKLSGQTRQLIPSLLRPTYVSASPSVSNSFQACSPGHPKFDSPLNHPCSSSAPLWTPKPRSTSTPQSSQVKSNPLHRPAQVHPVGEPVDTFINRLVDGQETVFKVNLNSSLTHCGIALLREQKQKRLPPLEHFRFTGKAIEWPRFIERFLDQIHNKTTVTDSDRMSYLFQNLSGEAKKAVGSFGVAGHSYPTALKTLKRRFGNPSSVASAYLKNILANSVVSSQDRQALRYYYYQVKACTTWCVKMGQSAILLTLKYLSRATMRLPINLRVRWYEHIDGHTERATFIGFERWVCKRVDTLFNQLEDFICEVWNKRQTCTRPKSNLKLHSLATTTKPPRAVQIQPYNKEGGKPAHPNKQKCVVCLDRHRVALCPVFKSKALRKKKQVVREHRLCFNGLRANPQSKECPSTNSLQVLSEVPRSINQVSVQPRRELLLQILPVQIHGPRGVVDMYAALDAKSDSTLIKRDLADHLRLGGETH